MEGKPPFEQDRVYCWVNLLPQAQVVGAWRGYQPYCSASASWRAPLCKANLNSSTGRVVSRLEAPFSWERARVGERLRKISIVLAKNNIKNQKSIKNEFRARAEIVSSFISRWLPYDGVLSVRGRSHTTLWWA